MFIVLVKTSEANLSIEEESFSKAIQMANVMADYKENGIVYSTEIFETDKVVMGSANIAEECKLVAVLKSVR